MAEIRWDDEKPKGQPAIVWDDAKPLPDTRSTAEKVWTGVKGGLQEGAQNVWGDITGAARTAGRVLADPGRAVIESRPSAATALPLSLPGGGTVATRLGAFAAGSMLDEPKATAGENLATAAKGTALPAAFELLGILGPPIARALPGMKAYLSRRQAKRFGQTLEDFGVPGARSAEDFADAATEAAKRRMAAEEGFRGDRAAYPAAVAEARSTAAQATRGGRADRAAEWQRRQEAHRQAVEAAEEEARQATARATTAQRGQQAEDIRDVITRNVPQLGPAFEGQTGAAALRTAGAGRARTVLGAQKEQVTRALEQGAPEGILVPSLSRPAEEAFTVGPLGNIVPAGGGAPQRMPIRDALEELSLLGSDRTTQFARNPLDRNIQGAARRRRYGELWNEIKRGLDEAREGLGDMFAAGQAPYKEGLAASKALLEPDAAYLPTGEVNLPGIASRVQKPRMRRALEEKLGPERFEQMAGEIGAIPREVPRIEPTLPPPPRRPMAVAPVHPDIPPAPTPPRQSPPDIVMSMLFGPQQRILQGRDTLVNWPAVQKALHAPEVRAALEAVPEIGPAGYERILRSALGGARWGADVPAAGSGRLGGPAIDWLSGREKGAGFMTSAGPRSLLPNAGAYYAGRKPLSVHPIVQMLLDLGAQRAGTRTER